MEKVVKWTEEEFEINYSKEWEQSVEIVYYEHDYVKKIYIIKYNELTNE